MMHLFYDERDDKFHEARGSQILYWLDDLGAEPLSEAQTSRQRFPVRRRTPYGRLSAPCTRADPGARQARRA